MEKIAITKDQQKVAERYDRYIETAKESWTVYNNSGGTLVDTSDIWYDKAEKLLQRYLSDDVVAICHDRGVGLYPTIEVYFADETKRTEYCIESFFKQINGFWS